MFDHDLRGFQVGRIDRRIGQISELISLGGVDRASIDLSEALNTYPMSDHSEFVAGKAPRRKNLRQRSKEYLALGVKTIFGSTNIQL
jgi:hypothetical protein